MHTARPPAFRRFLALGASLAAPVLLGGCDGLVNHFAFHPEKSKPVSADRLRDGESTFFITTSDGETLESFLLRNAASDRLVVYFHGNAGTIAQRLPELRKIAQTSGMSVLGVGYRGYGASSGSPDEAGIYLDGEAALAHATDTLDYPVERIILYGRSIGTTVAVHTAQNRRCLGIILITPLSTGRAFASAHGLGAFGIFTGQPFDNLGRAASLVAPVLVIHGTDDEVIPYEQGRAFFDAVTAPKRLVTIDRGRHNDLEFVDAQVFWRAVAGFSASPEESIASTRTDSTSAGH